MDGCDELSGKSPLVFVLRTLAGAFVVVVWFFVVQCFNFASLAFFPFGKEVRYGGGTVSLLLNLIWILVSGIPLAVAAAANGIILCCTIIGIPFGLQCFKMAKLALMPFGTEVS